MDQAGLALRDLVPFIGSRAKVSEVLSGKRAITMPMARALHDHLGIPAEVLLQQPSATADQPEDDIQWHRFPLKEMAKRNWIPSVSDLTARAEDRIDRAGGWQVARAALYRKNDHLRTNAKTDPYALQAWCWQVLATANDNLPDVIRRDPELTFFVIYQSEHAWERLEHVYGGATVLARKIEDLLQHQSKLAPWIRARNIQRDHADRVFDDARTWLNGYARRGMG